MSDSGPTSEDGIATGTGRRLGRRLLRAGRAGTAALRRHRGRTGFGLGLVVGVAATAATMTLVPPLFPTGPEAGELVILSGHDDGAGGQRQVLVDQWNATHPDNKARIEVLSSIADAQRSEMVARADKRTDQIDIYNLDVTWIAEFADQHYIRPLDAGSVDQSGFLEKPMKTCRYQNQLWALPFNTDAPLLYYRGDLVAAPPASWAQLVEQTRQVLAAGASGREKFPQAGFVGQLGGYEGRTVNALEAIIEAGGAVLDDDDQVVIDSKRARDGLKHLADGLAEASQQLIMKGSLDFNEAASTQAFVNGQALFMRNWPVAHRSLMTAPDTATGQSQPLIPFQVAPLPGGGVLGGQNLAVADRSRRPRAARALIEFLTSARSQQILFERGGFAATRAIVYQDAAVIRQYPYAPTLLKAVGQATPRPQLRHYNRFSAEFQEVVKETIDNDGQLPTDAVDRLRDAIRGR